MNRSPQQVRSGCISSLPLRWGVLVTWAMLLSLAGCDQLAGWPGRAAATAGPSKDKLTSVAVDSVNYRHDRGVSYTLYDLSQNPPVAVGGEITDRLASGGSKGCCLALPQVWQPGMKVLVKWTESDLKQSYPEQYARELEIPRYEKPADVYVVFYQDHEVEVVVSPAEPGHALWAGRIKSTPWENCVATQGRKPCKAALPKLFSLEESQGFCTYVKEENVYNGDALCEFSLMECVRDYEDEAMCRKALWGPRRKVK